MDFLKAANLLLSQTYKFAKTMPQHPYSYTLWQTKQQIILAKQFKDNQAKEETAVQ